MKKKPKNKISGSKILIEVLKEQGVTDVFGYPGGQVLSIYDELYKASNKIKHILTSHEQGAAHAADGYARATGKVGVVITTSGPGATNLVTGIATAMLDSVPMVAITGNVPTHLIGKDAFQEINITGITLPITKHNYFVTDVSELADTIREAFCIAKSGRPGPVLIDIPKDVQLAECEFTAQGIVEPFELPKADDSIIDDAVRLINSSKRPYIYIGGGAAGVGMTTEIIQLAEKIDAYIGCTLMAISAIPTSYDRFLGMQGMHGKFCSSMAAKDADLIIGVGVRFSDRATGDAQKYSKSAKIIQIDVDISEINKNVKVDAGLVGDLRFSFNQILQKCEPKQNSEWHRIINAYIEEQEKSEKEIQPSLSSSIKPKSIFNTINRLKDKSTVVVTDVGQHQMWTAQYTDFEMPRRFLSSGGLGTMGYGLGAAIGAQIGTNQKVLLITGDGSFGMNLIELATAVTYNIPVIIVVMNNGALGMVRQWQNLFYEERYSNSVLNRKTDFVKVALAFGANAVRVHSADEFEKAFCNAIKAKGPYLIDAVIDIDEFVLPMLPPGACADEIIVSNNQEVKK